MVIGISIYCDGWFLWEEAIGSDSGHRVEHEVEDFALLVDDQVELEPEEPAHGALSAHGNSLENPVAMDALVTAHPERSGIHETHTGAFAQEHFFDKDGHRKKNLLFKLYKTIV